MNKRSSSESITTPADMAAAQAIVSQANRLGMDLNEFAARSTFFSLPQQQQIAHAASIAAVLQQQQISAGSAAPSLRAPPLDLNDYAARNPMFNLRNQHAVANNSTLSNYMHSFNNSFSSNATQFYGNGSGKPIQLSHNRIMPQHLNLSSKLHKWSRSTNASDQMSSCPIENIIFDPVSFAFDQQQLNLAIIHGDMTLAQSIRDRMMAQVRALADQTTFK